MEVKVVNGYFHVDCEGLTDKSVNDRMLSFLSMLNNVNGATC